MKMNMELATDLECEKCKSRVFSSCFLIKKIPALVSPTGKDTIVPVETFACISCDHINKEFIPNIVAEQKIKT